MRFRSAPILFSLLAVAPIGALADSPAVSLSGTVPSDSAEFFLLPFTVPSGVAEIEIDHTSISAQNANILDWGLRDEAGRFRGWGGGNTEPAIIGIDRASRSYLTGPINAGTWNVLVGKAKVVDSQGQYQVQIYLRTSPTLAPQPERRPYKDVAPLTDKAGWYAGDLHVHVSESGDSKASIDEVATIAMQRGLNWVELSDHNTTSQLDYLGAYQDKYPNLLFVPGVEFTTYHGHANGIGATQFVDHTIGFNGVTIDGAAQAFLTQGAVFSPNHPLLNIPSLCIGCGWSYDLPAEQTQSFEIASGGFQEAGFLFDVAVLAQWDAMLDTGAHVAAVGGSDDHRAGIALPEFGSPVGDPTTLVYAENLSAPAIEAGIRAGRTIVKLDGPSDAMVTMTTTDGHLIGDTVHGSTHLNVTVTGGQGDQLVLVKNGEQLDPVDITSDPFEYTAAVAAPSSGTDRWRAEVLVTDPVNGQHPGTVTSHIWVAPATPKHGCASAGGAEWIAILGLFSARMKRRR
jgi:hypothetical protein